MSTSRKRTASTPAYSVGYGMASYPSSCGVPSAMSSASCGTVMDLPPGAFVQRVRVPRVSRGTTAAPPKPKSYKPNLVKVKRNSPAANAVPAQRSRSAAPVATPRHPPAPRAVAPLPVPVHSRHSHHLHHSHLVLPSVGKGYGFMMPEAEHFVIPGSYGEPAAPRGTIALAHHRHGCDDLVPMDLNGAGDAKPYTTIAAGSPLLSFDSAPRAPLIVPPTGATSTRTSPLSARVPSAHVRPVDTIVHAGNAHVNHIHHVQPHSHAEYIHHADHIHDVQPHSRTEYSVHSHPHSTEVILPRDFSISARPAASAVFSGYSASRVPTKEEPPKVVPPPVPVNSAVGAERKPDFTAAGPKRSSSQRHHHHHHKSHRHKSGKDKEERRRARSATSPNYGSDGNGTDFRRTPSPSPRLHGSPAKDPPAVAPFTSAPFSHHHHHAAPHHRHEPSSHHHHLSSTEMVLPLHSSDTDLLLKCVSPDTSRMVPPYL